MLILRYRKGLRERGRSQQEHNLLLWGRQYLCPEKFRFAQLRGKSGEKQQKLTKEQQEGAKKRGGFVEYLSSFVTLNKILQNKLIAPWGRGWWQKKWFKKELVSQSFLYQYLCHRSVATLIRIQQYGKDVQTLPSTIFVLILLAEQRVMEGPLKTPHLKADQTSLHLAHQDVSYIVKQPFGLIS